MGRPVPSSTYPGAKHDTCLLENLLLKMAVVSIGIFFRHFLLSVLFGFFFYRESPNLYKGS